MDPEQKTEMTLPLSLPNICVDSPVHLRPILLLSLRLRVYASYTSPFSPPDVLNFRRQHNHDLRPLVGMFQ